ncbi:MAG: 2-C-methyl-D-erythritol 2,4-cyclodiphosphate synthase [Bacteroidales bacterium]|nr:2-C-methyl-D-erythritol 2,4-cyclodiphosphate synthase [Bacteroidales bacterium]
MKCDIRTGNGYDVHRLAPGLKLTLGGITIEHEKGCVAHSDGDVIIHALCDALLGALALGDIGHHFPDTSEEFKGIDSKILLRRTYDLVRSKSYSIVNADITLLLQAPKIAPYVVKMRQTLAAVLEVPVDAVSIKATTTERLGFVGREEGVAAYAAVLICKD